MKKITSLLLVCVLLVGCVFTLGSCVFSAGPITIITGEYEADLALAEYTLEFSPFGGLTVTEDPVIGNENVYKGKYKVNSETEKITLTWDGDAPVILPEETLSFSYGEENGVDYITIALVKFTISD